MSNKQRGNMYGFITKNFIKGICPHQCSYCYMKRWWPKLGEPRLDEKEFKENLKSGRFYFIGSSIDMWSFGLKNIYDMLPKILIYLNSYPDNWYLFQSKNPEMFLNYINKFPKNSILCTTIETPHKNKFMGNNPSIIQRVDKIYGAKKFFNTMITIEPIMDFNLKEFIQIINLAEPNFINIGADSGKNKLPEPSSEKLKEFIIKLKEVGYKPYLKSNLKRLLKN